MRVVRSYPWYGVTALKYSDKGSFFVALRYKKRRAEN